MDQKETLFKETEKKIFSTMEYSLFKRLECNRAVTQARVDRIKTSIQNVGYITNPIVVNENMEVIDGQGRVRALKELELPVEFIISPGAGIEECRQMNIYQSNWEIYDYIDSYAEEGNESFILLQRLTNKYKKLPFRTILGAITGLDYTNNQIIRTGKFKMSSGEYEFADGMLDYEIRFYSMVSRLEGKGSYMFMAIGYAYKNETVDNEKLYESYVREEKTMRPVATKLEALDRLSEIYNKHVRGESKIYLKTDYQRELDRKYPWYDSRYLLKMKGRTE